MGENINGNYKPVMRDADAVASTKDATKLKARTRESTDRSIAAMQKSRGNTGRGSDLMLKQTTRNKTRGDYKVE